MLRSRTRSPAQGTQRFPQSGSHQTFCFGYRRIQPESSTQYPPLLAESCSGNPCTLQHTFCYASPRTAERCFGTSQEVGEERFPTMRRGAAATHSTPHVLTAARSHPLCSRPTVHCGLLHLLQSFPLKSLTLWAQKLPQRRSQPCVCYLAVNKDSISVPARRPLPGPGPRNLLNRHLCLSYSHRKEPLALWGTPPPLPRDEGPRPS